MGVEGGCSLHRLEKLKLKYAGMKFVFQIRSKNAETNAHSHESMNALTLSTELFPVDGVVSVC